MSANHVTNHMTNSGTTIGIATDSSERLQYHNTYQLSIYGIAVDN